MSDGIKRMTVEFELNIMSISEDKSKLILEVLDEIGSGKCLNDKRNTYRVEGIRFDDLDVIESLSTHLLSPSWEPGKHFLVACPEPKTFYTSGAAIRYANNSPNHKIIVNTKTNEVLDY